LAVFLLSLSSERTQVVRWPVIVLTLLVTGLQYPLWLGKGGWFAVWEVEKHLAVQKQTNQRLLERNQRLEAEVRDLKSAYEAIEERARFELGLVKPGEMLIRVPQREPTPPR
jgi:cell division protein FtsB